MFIMFLAGEYDVVLWRFLALWTEHFNNGGD